MGSSSSVFPGEPWAGGTVPVSWHGMLPPVSAGTAGAVGRPARAASRQEPVARSRARSRVTALTVATAGAFAPFGFLPFPRFPAGTVDPRVFERAVRGDAHFRRPT